MTLASVATSTTSKKPAGFSPPVHISQLTLPHGTVHVVREDLLPGGTKQRAVAPYVQALMARGYNHFVYASPFCGFAQVALAYVCRQLGVSCTVVASRDPDLTNVSAKHEFTCLAEDYGADVLLAETLSEAEAFADGLSQNDPRTFKPPLGFDCPLYREHLVQALKREWARVLARLERRPRALWLPVGSGTLVKTFSAFVEPEIELHALNVHVLAHEDRRIQAVRENPRVTLFSAPQPFAAPASLLPAVPSNRFYDAKLWDLIARYGVDGDVWWNVAR